MPNLTTLYVTMCANQWQCLAGRLAQQLSTMPPADSVTDFVTVSGEGMMTSSNSSGTGSSSSFTASPFQDNNYVGYYFLMGLKIFISVL